MMKSKKGFFTLSKRAVWLLALSLAFIIGIVPCFLQGANHGSGEKIASFPSENEPILSHKVTDPFAGSGSAEPPEHHTVYGGLAEEEDYLFALAADENSAQLLADENLYFADQKMSDNNGGLVFDYIPRSYATATACLFGESRPGMTELTWFISGDTLTVSGNSAIGNYTSDAQSPWYGIRSSIENVVIRDGITGLGKNAFANCGSLRSVSIPETVTEVTGDAFTGCFELDEVTVLGMNTDLSDRAFPANSDLVIKGHKGSKAESFAQAQGLEFVVIEAAKAALGDVDGDGMVTIIDVTYIQKDLAGIPLTFAFDKAVADADRSGSVTVLDATYIQRWLADLLSDDRIGKPIG